MRFRLAMGACAAVAAVALVTVAPAHARAQQAKASAAGVYTDAQAKRGEALYVENCAQCHAPDLSGGELSPSLTGTPFLSRWNVKGVGALFDYMRSAMPLNSPGGLSAAQNADILAFLLQRGGLPAGKTDLQTSALGTIKLQ